VPFGRPLGAAGRPTGCLRRGVRLALRRPTAPPAEPATCPHAFPAVCGASVRAWRSRSVSGAFRWRAICRMSRGVARAKPPPRPRAPASRHWVRSARLDRRPYRRDLSRDLDDLRALLELRGRGTATTTEHARRSGDAGRDRQESYV